MATKKTAKKAAKKTTKKPSKSEAAPKKKAKKVVEEKSAKKGTKKTGKKMGRPKKPESEKAKRKVQSTLIKEDDIPPKALKAIQKADQLEIAAADAMEAFRDQLSKIPDLLGGRSFEHPERGPMSIMERGYWFWRKKPYSKKG